VSLLLSFLRFRLSHPFALADEECTVPKGSDEKFVSKMNQIFDENPNTKSVFYLRSHKSALSFTVRHFAGDVTYNAGNFLEKNRDTIVESLLKLIQTSSLTILKTPAEVEGETPAVATSSKLPANKKNSKLTLCAKFKNDLDNLMAILRSTFPHFVRCIKPNLEQVPTKFDAPLVLNQLKYSGLFEAIRIRKAGYEIRMPFEQFVQRYKHCFLSVPRTIDRKTQHREYAEYLLLMIYERISSDPVYVERRKALEKQSLLHQKKGNKNGGPAAIAESKSK
jgi:myosin heavy subunit